MDTQKHIVQASPILEANANGTTFGNNHELLKGSGQNKVVDRSCSQVIGPEKEERALADNSLAQVMTNSVPSSLPPIYTLTTNNPVQILYLSVQKGLY